VKAVLSILTMLTACTGAAVARVEATRTAAIEDPAARRATALKVKDAAETMVLD
jgi:hypothetical protein